MAQNGSKMVPKWQNGPKMAPSRSQDGPKMPQEGRKKQQKRENEKSWAPRGATPVSESPLGIQVGTQVDPFWKLFVNMFAKRFLHRFLMVFGRPPNLHFLILAEAKTQF